MYNSNFIREAHINRKAVDSVQTERYLLSSSHEDIIAFAKVLQSLPEPTSSDNNGRSINCVFRGFAFQ